MATMDKLPASFRDPSGFIFTKEGILYRQVNNAYKTEYDLLMESGLYDHLVRTKSMVSHKEIQGVEFDPFNAYKIIMPERINFVSYPYEWCFSQLKDAALLTLKIQQIAMRYKMTLKDASAYNVQFVNGCPVFIDTLSFERYEEGQAWVAYRQFCQHFLAPLALMAQKDIRFGRMLSVFIDGIPLDFASKQLPKLSWAALGLSLHLHIHAKTQKVFSKNTLEQADRVATPRPVSKHGLEGLLNSLTKTVSKLKWKPGGTEWGDYYSDTNYSDDAFKQKAEIINKYLDTVTPENVWDLGGNTGVFSRIASDKNIPTCCFDVDPTAVEINYRRVRAKKEKSLLPLLLDLTNPSSALGWDGDERNSIYQRGPAGCVFALALMHHLAISNNVPFDRLAAMFSKLGKYLIIEFVPKSDSQVQRLLRSREDIFKDYTQENFEFAFSRFFTIEQRNQLHDSERILYLMKLQ